MLAEVTDDANSLTPTWRLPIFRNEDGLRKRIVRYIAGALLISCVAVTAFFLGRNEPATRLTIAVQDLSSTTGRLDDAQRQLKANAAENERLKTQMASQRGDLTQVEQELAAEVRRSSVLEDQLASLAWTDELEETPAAGGGEIQVTDVDDSCEAVDHAIISASLLQLFEAELDRQPQPGELEELTTAIADDLSGECAQTGFMPDARASAEVAFYDGYDAELDFKRRQEASAQNHEVLQDGFDNARDMLMGGG